MNCQVPEINKVGVLDGNGFSLVLKRQEMKSVVEETRELFRTFLELF